MWGHREDKWPRLLTLLPWLIQVSLQIPDTEISQKTVGVFSEWPRKISSPLWQTVLSALHVAISCSVSREREHSFSGGLLFSFSFFFFNSGPICHVSHMQVLYTLYTDSASKNLNYFSFSILLLSFDVCAAILFLFQYQAHSS